MQKEVKEVKAKSSMTSTAQQQYAKANLGYISNDAGDGYHYPIANFHETDGVHPGYPQPPQSMLGSYPPLNSESGVYYSTTQYMVQTEYPQYHYPGYYYYAPQQMNYGSWSDSTPHLVQQEHYQSHEARRGSDRSSASMESRRQYGSSELSAFKGSVDNKKMIQALKIVRRNPNATLFDIDESIADVAMVDEVATRFIHKRLKLGTEIEQRLALTAALSSIEVLCDDHYGNFMLQGLFEFGPAEMKKELMDAVYGQDVVALCLNTHGCRMIQKAIQCLDQEDVCKLITKFKDYVLPFTHDPNGNHVIQRCIQVMSSFSKCAMNNGDPDLASSLSGKMQFIIDDIVANVETLSAHRYGCRVVQRVVEHCEGKQKQDVLDGIMSCDRKLAVDQYGNYVIQQVFMHGGEDDTAKILETLTENNSLLSLSKHKYASNVVESVLVHGKSDHKKKIIDAMLKDTMGDEEGEGYCCVLELSMDPIANYVVKKAIDVSEKDQQERFVEVVSSSRQELSKSPFGKYVLKRIDKLVEV